MIIRIGDNVMFDVDMLEDFKSSIKSDSIKMTKYVKSVEDHIGKVGIVDAIGYNVVDVRYGRRKVSLPGKYLIMAPKTPGNE